MVGLPFNPQLAACKNEDSIRHAIGPNGAIGPIGPRRPPHTKKQNFEALLCKDEEKLRNFLLQGFIPAHSLATIRRRGKNSKVTGLQT